MDRHADVGRTGSLAGSRVGPSRRGYRQREATW